MVGARGAEVVVAAAAAAHASAARLHRAAGVAAEARLRRDEGFERVPARAAVLGA